MGSPSYKGIIMQWFRVFKLILALGIFAPGLTAAEVLVQSISNQPAFHYGKSWQSLQVIVRVETTDYYEDQQLLVVLTDENGTLRRYQAEPWLQVGKTHTVWKLTTGLDFGSYELRVKYQADGLVFEPAEVFEIGEYYGIRLFTGPVQLSYLSNPSESGKLLLIAYTQEFAGSKKGRLHVLDEHGLEQKTLDLKPMSTVIDKLSRDKLYADVECWFIEITDPDQIHDKTFYLSYEVDGETYLDTNLGYYYRLGFLK